MECEFCGESLSEGALACPRCGSPITRTTPPAATPGPSRPGPGPGADGELPPWEIQVEPRKKISPSSQGAAPRPASAPGQSPSEAVQRPPQVQRPPGQPPVPPAWEQQPPPEPVSPQTLEQQQPPVQVPPPVWEEPTGALAIPPGAYAPPEKAVLGNSMTGGYQGGVESSSVAGAGVQTADDPFGLNITEKVPPMAQTGVHGEKSRLKTAVNVAVIIIAILVAGGVACAGVYYGFLRKKTASPAEPVAALHDYVNQVLSGDQVRINSVSVPGATYGSEIMAIVEPLTKQGGVASLKSFEARTTSMTPAGKPTNATVEVSILVVNITADGETRSYDLLGASSQNKLRTTVTLINQNGTWKVSN